ncbi:hypothetical protein BST27_27405 [Mycobacterium intermedium]|uniref:Uncharacterized protein n=1 Tax=Mycobacterium intermedium TaxID=28445 RepID=A0A1E3S4B2_MYCIE|nr:hypothetical protein [Mycobacterium intermedium]MCV6965360.1 hypothetical protein [Mycobacterium intermedium]ODQ96968.1 hypothetical protein BHQ20_28135 [Mycobacterium intermedium]OPE46588.1 hypothetical protein BV508_25435 [Mycobacterium intermedium]ORA94802.1 hypothetical protein BST27_27405 [Mycobacterium intermedium]
MPIDLRKILSFDMTIAEWLGTAAMLLVPYLVIGVVWLAFHTHHLAGADAGHRIVLILGTIASWPALLVANVCLS